MRSNQRELQASAVVFRKRYCGLAVTISAKGRKVPAVILGTAWALGGRDSHACSRGVWMAAMGGYTGQCCFA